MARVSAAQRKDIEKRKWLDLNGNFKKSYYVEQAKDLAERLGVNPHFLNFTATPKAEMIRIVLHMKDQVAGIELAKKKAAYVDNAEKQTTKFRKGQKPNSPKNKIVAQRYDNLRASQELYNVYEYDRESLQLRSIVHGPYDFEIPLDKKLLKIEIRTPAGVGCLIGDFCYTINTFTRIKQFDLRDLLKSLSNENIIKFYYYMKQRGKPQQSGVSSFFSVFLDELIDRFEIDFKFVKGD